MEQWFLFSVITTVFAGLHIFIQKVAVVRGCNSSLLNSSTAVVAAVCGLIVTGWFEGFSDLTWFLTAWALVNGVFYMIGTNLRMDALRYVDATIALPIHKFVCPLIALVFGLLFFEESLSVNEWWGILLGVSVPLLLISRTEKIRQYNLSKGLVLILVSAVFAALVAAINKEGTNIFASVLLFAAVSQTLSATFGFMQYRLSSQFQSLTHLRQQIDMRFIQLAVFGGLLQFVSFTTLILAFSVGGPLGIVYAIHSLYIVIPIVLAIIFYKEHWNARKVIAIIASIVAIGLLR